MSDASDAYERKRDALLADLARSEGEKTFDLVESSIELAKNYQKRLAKLDELKAELARTELGAANVGRAHADALATIERVATTLGEVRAELAISQAERDELKAELGELRARLEQLMSSECSEKR